MVRKGLKISPQGTRRSVSSNGRPRPTPHAPRPTPHATRPTLTPTHTHAHTHAHNAEVDEATLNKLVRALDDDNSGSIGLDELADFVQRGSASLFAGPEASGVADNGVADSWDVGAPQAVNVATAQIYRPRSRSPPRGKKSGPAPHVNHVSPNPNAKSPRTPRGRQGIRLVPKVAGDNYANCAGTYMANPNLSVNGLQVFVRIKFTPARAAALRDDEQPWAVGGRAICWDGHGYILTSCASLGGIVRGDIPVDDVGIFCMAEQGVSDLYMTSWDKYDVEVLAANAYHAPELYDAEFERWPERIKRRAKMSSSALARHEHLARTGTLSGVRLIPRSRHSENYRHAAGTYMAHPTLTLNGKRVYIRVRHVPGVSPFTEDGQPWGDGGRVICWDGGGFVLTSCVYLNGVLTDAIRLGKVVFTAATPGCEVMAYTMWDNYKTEVLDEGSYQRPKLSDAELERWPAPLATRSRSGSPQQSRRPPHATSEATDTNALKPGTQRSPSPRRSPSPGRSPQSQHAQTVGGSGHAGVKALRNSRSDSALHDGDYRGESFQKLHDKVESWVGRREGKETKSPKRKRKKKQDPVSAAKRYTKTRVDPLMREMINYLLAEQPEQTEVAILKFLVAKRNGTPPPSMSNQTDLGRFEESKMAEGAGSWSPNFRPPAQRVQERLYMGREVQPLLQKLMTGVLQDQPTDVESHLISQLRELLDLGGEESKEKGPEEPEDSPDADADPTETNVLTTPQKRSKSIVPRDPLTHPRVAADISASHLNQFAEREHLPCKVVAANTDGTYDVVWFERRVPAHRVHFYAEEKDPWPDRKQGGPDVWTAASASPTRSARARAPASMVATNPTGTTTKKKLVSTEPDLVVGSAVLVNYYNNGKFFPAKIDRVLDRDVVSICYDVKYEDGERESRVGRWFIKLLDASGKPIAVAGTAYDAAQEKVEMEKKQEQLEALRLEAEGKRLINEAKARAAQQDAASRAAQQEADEKHRLELTAQRVAEQRRERRELQADSEDRAAAEDAERAAAERAKAEAAAKVAAETKAADDARARAEAEAEKKAMRAKAEAQMGAEKEAMERAKQEREAAKVAKASEELASKPLLPGVYRVKTTAHEAGQQAAGWGLAAWHNNDRKRNDYSSWVCVHSGDEWPCDWTVSAGRTPGTYRISTNGHKAGGQPKGWGLAAWHGMEDSKRDDYSSWAAVHSGDEWPCDWTIVPGKQPDTWRILTVAHEGGKQPTGWGLSAWHAHGAERNDWSSNVAVHSGDEYPMDWVFEAVAGESEPKPEPTPPAAEPQPPSDTLPMNCSLSAGEFLLSQSRRYKAVLQADGNLCVYAVYEGGRAEFRYGTINSSPDPANVAEGEGTYTATMQADGNLIVTWAPAANPTAAEFKFGTVQAGQYEPSATSTWRAVMQDDGNLVVYGGDEFKFGTVQHGGYNPELLPSA